MRKIPTSKPTASWGLSFEFSTLTVTIPNITINIAPNMIFDCIRDKFVSETNHTRLALKYQSVA
jgi:hypothetical protein